MTRDQKGLVAHREPIEEAEDYLGYSLIAATVAVGVTLAIMFAAF